MRKLAALLLLTFAYSAHAALPVPSAESVSKLSAVQSPCWEDHKQISKRMKCAKKARKELQAKGEVRGTEEFYQKHYISGSISDLETWLSDLESEWQHDPVLKSTVYDREISFLRTEIAKRKQKQREEERAKNQIIIKVQK